MFKNCVLCPVVGIPPDRRLDPDLDGGPSERTLARCKGVLSPDDGYRNERCTSHPREPGCTAFRWVLAPAFDASPLGKQADRSTSLEMADRLAHRGPRGLGLGRCEEAGEQGEGSRQGRRGGCRARAAPGGLGSGPKAEIARLKRITATYTAESIKAHAGKVPSRVLAQAKDASAWATYNLGCVQLRSGRRDEGYATLERMALLHPKTSYARAAGRILKRAGRVVVK